jgi:hypothetical protein
MNKAYNKIDSKMHGIITAPVIITMIFIFACFSSNAMAQAIEVKDVESWNLREGIAPYFSPPDEYKNQYGDYRSPLKFYDGRDVKTPGDWKKRRNEILDRWHGMMGQWPPLIKRQKMEILESSIKDGYTQHHIKFYWLPGQKTDAYLLVPDGKGKRKRPAVITVFYQPETAVGLDDRENRDFALQLAKRGFVALSIGTTETTNSKTYSLYYPDIHDSHIQPLSVLAYAAANAWHLLANHPEVDSRRIGIVGHSYGGKWAMFASCLFEKFACAAWSDPGIVFDETKGSNVNYWEPWYLGYYPPPWQNAWRKTGMVDGAKGLYPKLIEDGYDLHELHALMAPRPFLVSGGSSDPPYRWVPLNHAIDVNKLLGYHDRVSMTNRVEHSPNAASNEAIYKFFEYFLK